MGKKNKVQAARPVGSVKKQAVLEAKKSRKGVILVAGVAVLAAAFIALSVFYGGGPGGSFQPVNAEAGVVSLPLEDISDGIAHYYSFDPGYGDKVNFFVLRSSDGVIRAAFDACDVCYREKKGYRQEGDFMVCNNCGQRFPSAQINVLRGGCNPAPIERNIEGQHLLIKASDIESGRTYF
jgi:uncharacterized membrane protein